MKKILFLLLLAGVAFVAVRKTHIGSYVSASVAQVSDEVKRSVPTKFELQRIRNEIARLDQDISRMSRPVAEYKTEVDWLQRDITKAETNLESRREDLLKMTRDLKDNPNFITYGERKYSANDIRHKLQKDFNTFKRMEADLKVKQKTLESKEASLKATQDQLTKVIEKKREYELRVSQLEAENATLEVARIGSRPKFDDSRATRIEADLTEMEKRLDVEKNELSMQQNLATDGIQVQQRAFDLDAIAEHLQPKRTETAQSSK
jgi:peptidoglycan hydrolase CwlO-like protein